MNVRAEEVVLKAKTNVANLQPVTVLGTIPGKGIKEAESTQLKVVESEREIAEFIEELVNTVHESVPDSTRSALRDILLRHADVFSRTVLGLGNRASLQYLVVS